MPGMTRCTWQFKGFVLSERRRGWSASFWPPEPSEHKFLVEDAFLLTKFSRQDARAKEAMPDMEDFDFEISTVSIVSTGSTEMALRVKAFVAPMGMVMQWNRTCDNIIYSPERTESVIGIYVDYGRLSRKEYRVLIGGGGDLAHGKILFV